METDFEANDDSFSHIVKFLYFPKQATFANNTVFL